MSGATALFGNTAGRNQSKNLVEFKAGKMSMRGKMVYPDKRKGLLYIHQSDDSLIHFCWKDRSSGVVEDVSDYIQQYLNYWLNSLALGFGEKCKCICQPLFSN